MSTELNASFARLGASLVNIRLYEFNHRHIKGKYICFPTLVKPRTFSWIIWQNVSYVQYEVAVIQNVIQKWTVGIRWIFTKPNHASRMIKHTSRLISIWMVCLEICPHCSNQSEAKKQWEFSIPCPYFNQAWAVPLQIFPTSLKSIWFKQMCMISVKYRG